MSTFYANKDIYDHVITYEDLVQDPAKEMGKIFELLNVDKEHVSHSLQAMIKDSQNNRGFQGGRPRFGYGPNQMRETEDLFSVFGVGMLSFDMSVQEFKETLILDK